MLSDRPTGDNEDRRTAAPVIELTPFEYVRSTQEAAAQQEPADLEDYQRIQTRRIYLEKWINEPFFEKVLPFKAFIIYINLAKQT